MTKSNLLEINDCQTKKICSMKKELEQQIASINKNRKKKEEQAQELHEAIRILQCRNDQLLRTLEHNKANCQKVHEILVTEKRKRNAWAIKVEGLQYTVQKHVENIENYENKMRFLNQEFAPAKAENQGARKTLEQLLDELEQVKESLDCVNHKLEEERCARDILREEINHLEEEVKNAQLTLTKHKQDIKKLKATLKVLKREASRLHYDHEMAEREE